MAFQIPVDPLIEQLQEAIDHLDTQIDDDQFIIILQKIDHEFPFVDLLEFLELFMNGVYTRDIIQKFHIFGYVEYTRLLQILKINLPRFKGKKGGRENNIKNKELFSRYNFLHTTLSKFQNIIKNKINHNIFRAIVILQLFSFDNNFCSKKKFLDLLPQAMRDYDHLILVPHKSVQFNAQEHNKLISCILNELQEESHLEMNQYNNFRLEPHQLQISHYLLNIIKNRDDGITYEDLVKTLKKKLPLLSQIPLALIEIELRDLITKNIIITITGYWQYKPFNNQFFTINNYKKLIKNNTYVKKHARKFYGRKITSVQFIHELLELEKGNFEDQDDQVTRIAGMILVNSNMMSLPPNNLNDFDFTINLSNYELTKEQHDLMKNLKINMSSNIIHVGVMIDEKIDPNKIIDLDKKLQLRQNEQGFLICFSPIDNLTEKILEKNNTIQIISQHALQEWCKITPVIPARLGSIAVIRYGDHIGNIVNVKSINYESGQTDIILLSTMQKKIQYIGSLEEITIPVSLKNFINYSTIYFQFLIRLQQISNIHVFKKIITDGLKSSEYKKIDFVINDRIECIFDMNTSVRINLNYLTHNTFSCSCLQWKEHKYKNGLCPHLIFSFNELVKKILALEKQLTYKEIEKNLKFIELQMIHFENEQTNFKSI